MKADLEIAIHEIAENLGVKIEALEVQLTIGISRHLHPVISS